MTFSSYETRVVEGARTGSSALVTDAWIAFFTNLVLQKKCGLLDGLGDYHEGYCQ